MQADVMVVTPLETQVSSAILSSVSATTVSFGQTMFAATTGIFIAALFFVCLENHWRNRNRATTRIHRDKRHISRTYVRARICKIIFYPDFHADFHGSVESAIDGRTQDNKISGAGGTYEIEMIDGSRHHVVARVAVRGHGGGNVHPMHEAAAEEAVQWVGVVGENEFRHFRLRVANGAGG